MAYSRISIKAADVIPGDIFVSIAGYSGNLNSGRRIQREVLTASIGPYPNQPNEVVVYKLKDRASGRISKDWDFPYNEVSVYRKV